jgi:hypothetical protein
MSMTIPYGVAMYDTPALIFLFPRIDFREL